MRHPVKFTGVYDCSSDCRAVAVHIFRRGVGDNIRPELDRSAVDRCRERIVHDKGNTMGMRRFRELLKIQDRKRRICDRFAEDRLRIRTESGIKLLFRAVRRDKSKVNSHLAHGHVKKIKCSAVNGRARNHMISRIRNIENGIKVRSLAGRCEHTCRSAFHLRDLCSNIIIGGILKPRIKIAARLQIKKLCHVAARVILEGRALYDRDLTRLSVSRSISSLYTLRFNIPACHTRLLSGILPTFHENSLLSDPGCSVIRCLRHFGDLICTAERSSSRSNSYLYFSKKSMALQWSTYATAACHRRPAFSEYGLLLALFRLLYTISSFIG